MDSLIYTHEEIPPMLTVAEVAKFLGIGKNQTYDLIRSGKLEVLRLGRKIKVPRHCLLRFLGI